MERRTTDYRDVVLGFTEPASEDAFEAHKFPSKVYAPVEPNVVGHNAAFHRVLYVALCRAPGCLNDSRCVSVLRGQVGRKNDFYPFDAVSEGGVDVCTVGDESVSECALCGFYGESRCGKCKQVLYCSRRCQSTDWKLGHKDVCSGQVGMDTQSKEAVVNLKSRRSDWLFKEFEIVTDEHPTPSSSDDEDEESDGDEPVQNRKPAGGVPLSSTASGLEKEGSEAADREEGSSIITGVNRLSLEGNGKSRYLAGVNVTQASVKGTFQDADEEELPEELFRGKDGKKTDPVFARFNKTVSYAPDQVIRYERNGKPLWGSAVGKCEEYGTCELCGGERIFELQIMPQLVYYLDGEQKGDGKRDLSISELARKLRDDIDWATIVVLTCRQSCEVGSGEYVKECAWLQRHRTVAE